MPKITIQNQSRKPIFLNQPPRQVVASGPVEIGFVIDRSGSMAHLKQSVITGFNYLLDEQRKIAPTAYLHLQFFSDEVQSLHRATPIENVGPLESADYMPCGSTALLDGIGRTAVEIGERYDNECFAHHAPPRVLIVILTDGAENASLTYSLESVQEMINFRRLQHNWQFIFMTADDAGVMYGLKLGIQRSNIVKFSADPEGIAAIMARLSAATKAYLLGDQRYSLLLK